VAANLKQDDEDQDGDIGIVECEVGMAGVKIVDGEAEAGPSTRGESEESREAFKVCPSSALRFTFSMHTLSRHKSPYNHPLQLSVLHTFTQITNHHHRRTTSPPPPALQGP